MKAKGRIAMLEVNESQKSALRPYAFQEARSV